jgi:hypothetical protein
MTQEDGQLKPEGEESRIGKPSQCHDSREIAKLFQMFTKVRAWLSVTLWRLSALLISFLSTDNFLCDFVDHLLTEKALQLSLGLRGACAMAIPGDRSASNDAYRATAVFPMLAQEDGSLHDLTGESNHLRAQALALGGRQTLLRKSSSSFSHS